LREERHAFRYDYILVATVILLTLLGLVTLYSASYLFAMNQPWRFGRGGWTPLVSNLIACAIMIVLFPVLAFVVKLDTLKKERLIIGLVVLTFVINLLPFIPFFQKSNFVPGEDVMRWIIIRRGGSDWLSFQPSEVIKFVLPLYLAYILDKNGERLDKFIYGPLPPALVTALFCALVFLQNNFSEVVLFALVGLTVCFFVGIRLRWFFVAPVLIAPLFIFSFRDRDGRSFQRIHNFFNPGTDVFGANYQIDMSMEAIRAGGFWGRGIGQGTVKNRIPEVHGDFVFASYAEEFGLVGVFLHMVLIGVFAGIVFYVVRQSKDRFSQVLAFGLVTPIVMQTLLNIAVVANVVPTTGVALPFVSSGGSSLLVTLCASALLVNLARRQALSLDKEERDVG